MAKDLLGVKLDKEMQTSDWGCENYSDEQIKYAASDVLHLHKIKVELDKILKEKTKQVLQKNALNF